MTREEIEQAIKNGESVWLALDDKVERLARLKWFTDDIVMDRGLSHMITKDYFNLIHKTKAEAEHYLHHANITRTETLPFLTWEEFLEKKAIHFIDNKGIDFVLRITDNKIKLMVFFMVSKTWDLTEENFYKAYDECVRMFRGEEYV